MTAWEWEDFSGYINYRMFNIEKCGPLLSPIRLFKLSRNKRLEVRLDTSVIGPPQTSPSGSHKAGTVRQNTDETHFTGHSGMTCVAHGVQPLHHKTTGSEEGGDETTETSKINSLSAIIRDNVDIDYTIDWLENLATKSSLWTGSSVKDIQETVKTRTLGFEPEQVELSGKDGWQQTVDNSVLNMVVAGVELYVCRSSSERSKKLKKPGYILYVGGPSNALRKKIRDILSFCLGNYLIYLGSITLCSEMKAITLHAVSPPLVGRIVEFDMLPPAPLGYQYAAQVDQHVVARMVNAIYKHYEELDFGNFSWVYWHARCAPVHMAAAHFGAAIEALQTAFIKNHPKKFETKLVTDKAKWTTLKSKLFTAVREAELDHVSMMTLINKIEFNLNQTPATALSDRFFSEIGISLERLELTAWKRRNMAAHGRKLEPDDVIPTIREVKLLKITLHRMILKITGASSHYYDDYSIGHMIRELERPVT